MNNNISLKFILIAIIFQYLILISYLNKRCKSDLVNFLHNNNNYTEKKYFKFIHSKDKSIINEPTLPENNKINNIKPFFKSHYNTNNIRYHFDDIYLNRKLFKINYSYLPYNNKKNFSSYDDYANYIYETTGMLNITKLDNSYYGNRDIDTSNLNHIHLSMGHDSSYILLSLVSIASILNTTNINTYIHFHFVLLDCRFEDMKPIISLKKIYNNIEFIFYNGKQAQYDFDRYGKKEKRGVGDYTKFLIPEIVNNTNKIIILDSADIIAKKDLSEIYFFDLENNYFGFALDIFAGKTDKYYLFAKNKFYPNIGICLVNIALFRKDNLYKEGFFFRLAYDFLPCPTQEMFFFISRYKFKYFPLIYNYPDFFRDDEYRYKKYNTSFFNFYLNSQKNSMFKYSSEEIIEAELNQVVNHLFYHKPYQKKANKKKGKIWVNYAKMANAYDKLKEKYPLIFKFYDS